jgi:tetratricopeptide (TPR) repeat protein
MLACSSPEATRDKAFTRGNAALEKQQYKEAIVAYRNALKADPLFAAGRAKLGEAYQGAGDRRAATLEFIRAADLSPKDIAAQLHATRYLLFSGRFEDAAARARRALDIDARNPEAHILLGGAIAGTKDLDTAIEQVQEAIDIDPAGGAGYANMGSLLLAKGRKEEAQRAFEKAVELDPKSVQARLALATFHLNIGQIKEAEAIVKEALALAPADPDANRAMAVLMMATGRAADAEPHVRAATAASDKPEAQLTLADYYLRINRIDPAREILERLAASEKLFVPASMRLAALDYAAGRKDQAHQRIDRAIDRAQGSVRPRVIKGRWLLAEGRTGEALAMADALVKASPESAAVQFLLGHARAANKDRPGAEQAFGEVLRLNPKAAAAQTELARLNLAAGKTEAGVRLARDAIRNQPSQGDPRILLVRGLIARREVEQAAAELAPLLRTAPEHPTVRALNGSVLVLRGDKTGARREFEQALQKDPGQLDALVGMTGLDAESGHLERARKRLAVQLERIPADPRLLLLAARADLLARDLGAGERRLREAITADPSFMPAYEMLALTLLQQRRLDEARAEFEQIAKHNPSAVEAHTLIGMIHTVQKNPAEAEKAYRRALEAGPAAPVAANNLAYMYAERNQNLEEALTLARGAAAHLRDNPKVLDTLGWVYYKSDKVDLAIPQFQQSVEQDPKNPIYYYHLGLAYAKAGDRAKARRALDEALRLNPSFAGADDARRMLSTLRS